MYTESSLGSELIYWGILFEKEEIGNQSITEDNLGSNLAYSITAPWLKQKTGMPRSLACLHRYIRLPTHYYPVHPSALRRHNFIRSYAFVRMILCLRTR